MALKAASVSVKPVGVSGTGGTVGTITTTTDPTGYTWQEFDLVLPTGPYQDALGRDVTTVPTEATLSIITTEGTTSGQVGIMFAQVDYLGSSVAGYLDGETTDTADVNFRWAGTAYRSSSEAVALTSSSGGTEPPADVAPTASFTASTSDLTVSVDASGSSDAEGALTYAWTFGDGGTATGVTASHTYAAAGTFTVNLTVTDSAGQTAATSQTVTTTTPPDEPMPGEPTSDPSLITDVLTFMGRTGDVVLENMALQAVPTIAEFVNAYVRGHGLYRIGVEPGQFAFPPDLRSVVITASARLLANPAQLDSESYDGYAARGSFSSFSLAEQAVLHRYRRRVA